MNHIYLDRPTVRALLGVVLSGLGPRSAVSWFDEARPASVARGMAATGLLGSVDGLVPFQVADIVDEDGAAQFYRIWEDGRDLVFRIMDDRVAAHPLVRRWAERFDAPSVEQLMAKAIDTDLLERVLLVNACEWHAREARRAAPVLFMERDLWTPELAAYAATRGITLREYGRLSRPSDRIYVKKLGRHAWALVSGIGRRVARLFRPAAASVATAATGVTEPRLREQRARVASWYTSRTVTFDRSLRSDLFWLIDAPIEGSRALCYFDRPDVPAPRETAEVLGERGVDAVAFSGAARGDSDIPVWSAGTLYRKERARLMRALLRDVVGLWVRFRPPAPFYVLNLFYYAEKYAWWYDFFTANNVKVSVSPYDFTKTYMPKNRALRDAGGVSVSYQWSNFDFASLGMSACADVYASFGPAYRPVFEANRSRIGTMLLNGYVTDLCFAAVQPRATELRSSLQAAGARYIVAFFDENSSDARSSVISDACAAGSYRRLLEWVIADESLGLVLKPGYPRTLRNRVGVDVSRLLDRAIATGRCVLMDSGSHVTDRYPAEAAQAADVAVGLLLSGTAALEAYLAGTPTVFIDVERLYHMPVYEQGGEGSVVFDSVADLIAAVDAERREPGTVTGFGDLSTWSAGRDTHRDGRSAERLGGYIAQLLAAFDEDASREQAIDRANEWYAREWGEDTVVPWG